MKKKIFAIVAIMIAVGSSAFTKIKRDQSDLVWFQVDAYSAEAINSSNGVRGDNPPITCPSGSLHCASALSISEGEVNPNSNGTFTIANGVDITDANTMNDTRNKN